MEALEDFLKQSKEELECILKELEWEGKDLKNEEIVLMDCPYNANHKIESSAFHKHVEKCALKSKGLKPEYQISLPSSKPFYETAEAVVQLEGQLDEIPKVEEELDYDVYSMYFPQPPPSYYQTQNYQQQQRMPMHHPQQQHGNAPKSLNQIPDLMVTDDKDEDTVLDNDPNQPNVPYQKLKSVIFSWKKIPAKVRYLNIGALDRVKVIDWISKHVIRYSKSFNRNENFHFVYNVVVAHCDPDSIVAVLTPRIGESTAEFVVSLWKFLALEVLELNHQYLVKTGQVTEKQDISQEIADKSQITNIVSKGRENMKPAERHAQYLHDVFISTQMRSTIPLKPLTLDFTPKQSEKGMKQKSELELLQEQRDYKRRRQKYRAKNVHITKRTPTMVARDFINQRLEDYGIDLDGNPVKEEEPKQAEEQYQQFDRNDNRNNFRRNPYPNRKGPRT